MQLLVTVTRISRRHSGRSHSTGAPTHMEEKKERKRGGVLFRPEHRGTTPATATTDNSSALQNVTIMATSRCNGRVYSMLLASPHESITELLLWGLKPQGQVINIPLGHLKKPIFWMSRSSSVQLSTFWTIKEYDTKRVLPHWKTIFHRENDT